MPIRKPVDWTHQEEQRALALARLEKEGLSLPTKPRQDLPDLPDDLTQLGDSALMELFGRLTGWAAYLSGAVALAEIDERAAETVLGMAEATALLKWQPTGKREDTVTVAKAQRTLDPEVQQRGQKVADAYAYRKLVSVLYGNVDRDAALVSRELTRRVGGADAKVRRSERWRA